MTARPEVMAVAEEREAMENLKDWIDRAPIDKDVPFGVDLQISTIEKACNDLLHFCSGHQKAWKFYCEGKNNRRASDLLDAAVVLVRNAARGYLHICCAVRETDPHAIDARKMLRDLVKCLDGVNVERDSAPGWYIIKEWMLCYYQLMGARFGDQGSMRALLRWRSALPEFARLNRG